MSIKDIRTAVATALTAPLNNIGVDIFEHAGRFDKTELHRMSVKAPAVFLAVLNVADMEEDGGAINGVVTFGIFIITKDTPSQSRDDIGLDVIQVLIDAIPGNDFSLDAQPAGKFSINNLYRGDIATKGVAMWAGSWPQEMDLNTPFDINTLNDFVLWRAEHSLVPGDDEPQSIDEVTA